MQNTHDMLDYEAPLAHTELSEEAELTLEDIKQMHEQARNDLSFNLPDDTDFPSPNLPSDALLEDELDELELDELDADLSLEDDSLVLDEDIELEDIEEDLDMAMEASVFEAVTPQVDVYEAIEQPEAVLEPITAELPEEPVMVAPSVSTSIPEVSTPAALQEVHNEASRYVVATAQGQYDLGSLDGVNALNQEVDSALQQMEQVMRQIHAHWNARQEIRDTYTKLEKAAKTDVSSMEIIALGQQIARLGDLSKQAAPSRDQLASLSRHLEEIRGVLRRYIVLLGEY